ncbi:DUF2207 domain-containing protein [Kribbella sp. NBC_01245]|uniref:DUF2207 domain-containing protein n=1 Tax=Kribbella sp. NBC_01245 TaxID=2903578 RepID=UPI002E29A38A|nr:DUF2207 domain-containing protein [Kribbella sp. NBC_01245]
MLHVTETIVYRFGKADPHGIFRDLLVREPYVDDLSKDQLYRVTGVQVSSPSGANAEVSEEPLDLDQGLGRQVGLRLRIGSADETVSGPTATYVIKYRVTGALRHFKDHSEVYWDATGSRWSGPMSKIGVTLQVPGGVTKVDCWAAPGKSKTRCASRAVKAGKGVFSHPSLPRGSQLTYVAAIKPGLVRNDKPVLEEAADSGVEPTSDPTDYPGGDYPYPTDSGPWEEEPMKDGASAGVLVAAGAVGLLVPVGAIARTRTSRRDKRYAELPPGTTGLAGAVVGPNTLRDNQIPVAYSPPPIAVAEAGFLLDGELTTVETAATLVDLAVRGAVRIEGGTDRSTTTVVLLDPALTKHPHERELLNALFQPLQAGESRTLRRGDGSMATAHGRLVDHVRHQVYKHAWYERMPSTSGGGLGLAIGLGGVGLILGFIVGNGTRHFVDGVLVAGAMLVAGISLNVMSNARAKGCRSAAGRAMTDQVLGFKTYLATAEADQLRFEEGEDIFSRYLPWAIAFGLADRWQEVCAELVAAGRIPATADWYDGPSYFDTSFTTVLLAQQLSLSFTPPAPPPTESSSGSSWFSGGGSSGFGGGGGSSSGFSSGFDSSSGGGSAGDGGGGGGGGSW